jgi:hypothetical protein
MLFPYTYVPHQMEKMQEYIDFIFFEVWCKAPIGLEFHPDLFKVKPDLQEVMSEFGFSKQAPERGKAFYKDVKGIYQLFAFLSPPEIGQFKQWYRDNNEIENVCANDPATQLVRYADIPVAHKDLIDQLKSFFKDLYSQSLLDLAALRKKIGDIDDHYQSFVTINKAGKCPFCGINDLLGDYHTKREAYDHYLPKSLYPFNSINFKNLVPACHHCNSSYKTSKDSAYTPKDPAGTVQRRAVFYPYTATSYAIELQVTLQHSNIENLTPADVSLQFGPAALAEKIDTWKDVYGIEERYKAKFCSNDSRDWLEQVRILQRHHNLAPTAYLVSLNEQVQQSPTANCNFLKKPFLEACHGVGLLDAIAKGENAP